MRGEPSGPVTMAFLLVILSSSAGSWKRGPGLMTILALIGLNKLRQMDSMQALNIIVGREAVVRVEYLNTARD
jgi:hypothetical protein